MTYKANTLAKAFEKAKELGYENGMATLPVIVERETETVRVVRKAPDPKHPEMFLITTKAKEGYQEPNLTKLGKEVKDALGLYGDINVKFKTAYNEPNFNYSCVINVF